MVKRAAKGRCKHPDQDYIHVDTRNILFICGGAFDGIERKIAQRLYTHVVGTARCRTRQHRQGRPDEVYRAARPQVFRAYPELIGRVPVLTYLNPLDESLTPYLVEPKNSIVKQFIKLFAMAISPCRSRRRQLDYVVDKAVEYKLGARGLRSIVEAVIYGCHV
jgi:ATP-dependent Clp protease ATP-binding subunit ClpX